MMKRPSCSSLAPGTATALACWLLGSISGTVSAQTGAAIGPEGTGVATVTATDAQAGRFHRQDGIIVHGPREHVNSISWRISYVVAARLSIDAATSWGRISVADGGSPSGGAEQHAGHTNVSLGITAQLLQSRGGTAIAVRVGAAYPGGYDAGYTNSLGDGTAVLDTSLLTGRTGRRWSWSAATGYRRRGTSFVNPAGIGRPATAYERLEVPAERYGSIELTAAVRRLRLGIVYEGVDATGGLDIGRFGWRADRWPALNQDAHLVGARIGFTLRDRYRADVFTGTTMRGRNAPAYRVIRVGLSTRFDTRKSGGTARP